MSFPFPMLYHLRTMKIVCWFVCMYDYCKYDARYSIDH